MLISAASSSTELLMGLVKKLLHYTDVEAVDIPGTSPVIQPTNNSSPKRSNKAAAIVAENKARLAEKQAAASAAKQAGLTKLGERTSDISIQNSIA